MTTFVKAGAVAGVLAVGFAIVATDSKAAQRDDTGAEHPTFEFMGLPITAHQAALLGAAGVQERSPTPTLTLGGMPASPLQILVLTRPRSIKAAAAKPAIEAVQPK